MLYYQIIYSQIYRFRFTNTFRGAFVKKFKNFYRISFVNFPNFHRHPTVLWIEYCKYVFETMSYSTVKLVLVGLQVRVTTWTQCIYFSRIELLIKKYSRNSAHPCSVISMPKLTKKRESFLIFLWHKTN